MKSKLFFLSIALVPIFAFAQPFQFGQETMKLRTVFTGQNSCLGILDDGNNNIPLMGSCNTSLKGQLWTQELISGTKNVRLKNIVSGQGMCVDIINDGQNNKLIMAECGDYSGQIWSKEVVSGTNSVRLRNMFSGQKKCLDIINDGQNNKLIMANCGNYSGQHWTLAVNRPWFWGGYTLRENGALINKWNCFSPQARERAVLVVPEQWSECPSPWAPIESIASKFGCVLPTCCSQHRFPQLSRKLMISQITEKSSACEGFGLPPLVNQNR